MQWGYIEELGLGVDKMIEAMVADGHPPPEFKATPHAFTVTLRKGREVGEPGVMRQWEQDMNERQMQALQRCRKRGASPTVITAIFVPTSAPKRCAWTWWTW